MPLVANITQPIPIDISVEVLNGYSAVCSSQTSHAHNLIILQMADELAEEAEAQAEAFEGIIISIMNFTATFSDFAATQKAGDQQMIDQLNSDIASLRKQIKGYGLQHSSGSLLTYTYRYNAGLIADAVAIGLTAFATAASLTLFPEFSSEILVSPSR